MRLRGGHGCTQCGVFHIILDFVLRENLSRVRIADGGYNRTYQGQVKEMHSLLQLRPTRIAREDDRLIFSPHSFLFAGLNEKEIESDLRSFIVTGANSQHRTWPFVSTVSP